MARNPDAQQREDVATAGRAEDLVAFTDIPFPILKVLLQDKTTGRNIIWATRTYETEGGGFPCTQQIYPTSVTGFFRALIQPRVCRSGAEQSVRTRTKAEVFTPGWVCEKMTARAEAELGALAPSAYVTARVLEVACGEAPFLVSRYDAVTGEWIPIPERFGLLDRKLRVVGARAATEAAWLAGAFRAFQSVYGFECQGDNLLIARVNLLNTFRDHLAARWGRCATVSELHRLATVIAWNLWQMDGLTGRVPDPRGRAAGGAGRDARQLEFFEPDEVDATVCRTFDWRARRPVRYLDIKKEDSKMKFSFVIGNPPYQEETDSDSTRMPPVYNRFMDGAFQISDRVEMITPARFLFNAGYTPKEWNRKMLADKHFKVLMYETDSSKLFANVSIKGGVCISYRDATKDFGAVEVFTSFAELNSIFRKVNGKAEESLSTIMFPPLSYKASKTMTEEHPELLERQQSTAFPELEELRLRSSAFTKLGELFFEEKPSDGRDYVQLIGLLGSKRVFRWVDRRYIVCPENFEFYKVIIPESNGSGAIGEVLCTPLIGEPLIGHTQTFMSIGTFKKKSEAERCLKYIKGRFARTLLGVKKITQHNPPTTWQYVPLQDFTSKSDIDWSQSIGEIDAQLYAKYGLDAGEIAFIESHVKEMA